MRNTKYAGYPTFKGQVLNGKQLWDLIEGLEANNLLFYTHLLTGKCNYICLHLSFLIMHNNRRVRMEKGVSPHKAEVCGHPPSYSKHKEVEG